MHFRFASLLIGSAAFLAICVGSDTAEAQQNPFRPNLGTNSTVQLPVIRFFNIRTVVSAPDGGMTSLGGVRRWAEGSRSSGIPGLAGRPFRNEGRGFEGSSSSLVLTPTIIINSELEEEVLAEAGRRDAIRGAFGPEGSAAVQKKADFITRNIGRRR